MRITYRETTKINHYTYSIIFDSESKKWGGIREFSFSHKAFYRNTKEEIIDCITKDANERKY